MAVTDELADYIARYVDAKLEQYDDIIARSIKLALQTQAARPLIEREGLEIGYGTVVGVSPIEVTVTLDADPSTQVPMFAVANVVIGERVAVLLVPPSSGVVLGTLGGLASSLLVQMTDGQVAAPFEIQDADGNDLVTITPTGSITMVEQGSPPPAPPTNGCVLYLVDNGFGRTELFALFASGAAQLIAEQP
jgi:hypothetical protein